MTEEIVPSSPQDDEPLKSELAKLPDRENAIAPVPRGVGEIWLPHEVLASFYANASKLEVTPEEQQKLKEFEIADDDDIEIRPDGLIYVEHMFYRQALAEVFGRGKFSMIPLSDVNREQRPNGEVLVFQRWMLVVRGCYVGQAIGSGRYFENNETMDKADAAEMTASNALDRIVPKTLCIGVNPFRKKFSRQWIRDHAVEVWVKSFKGNVRRWRRKDAEPLPGEIGPVKRTDEQVEARETPESEKAAGPVATPPEPKKAAPPTGPKHEETPAPAPAPAPQTEAPPPPSLNTLSPGQARLLFAEFRRKGMIKAGDGGKDDPSEALEFLLNQGIQMKTGPGKTPMEILAGTISAIEKSKFNTLILKIREAK